MEPKNKSKKETKVDTSETYASGEASADPGNVVVTGGDHTKTAQADMGLTTKVDSRAATADQKDAATRKDQKRQIGQAEGDCSGWRGGLHDPLS